MFASKGNLYSMWNDAHKEQFKQAVNGEQCTDEAMCKSFSTIPTAYIINTSKPYNVKHIENVFKQTSKLILKPFNGARGENVRIVTNLSQL